MKTHYLIALAIVFSFTACSPRIGSIITKTYPVNETDPSVTIFMDPSLAPTNSESLGVVSITDTGFSTKCDSVTVVDLLKEEARKAGGNAVVVTEYIRPNIWRSSCHQMTGTILRIHDFDSFVQTTDTEAHLAAIKVIQPERKLPKITLSANMGYGWRGAKLNPDLSGNDREYYKGLMSGLVGDASFNYYFNDYYGVGLIYSSYSASQNKYGYFQSEDGIPTENAHRKANNIIQFFGPAFLMRVPIGNQKWILDWNIGIGYLNYSAKETFLDEIRKAYGSTLGVHLALDAEYKIDQHWGIGLRLSEVVGVLGKWTTESNGQKETVSVSNPSKEGEGLGQIQLLLGIRYYIK
jgi:hypothetical protein